MMRALALLVLVAACASARPDTLTAPGPDAAPVQPDAPGPSLDAAPDAAVAVDAAVLPDAEPPGPCFATSMLGNLCLARVPIAPIAATAIDTDRDCTEVRPQTGGAPAVCILAGTGLEVRAGAVLVATGSRSLVLVATGRIVVAGELAVRSATGMRGSVPCAPAGGAALLNGFSPTFNRAGGGGGAGGTFGAANGMGQPPGIGRNGGRGGNPVDGVNLGAGAALFADVPSQLVGGCTGGTGGGEPSAEGGTAGAGGGAVYLVSGVEIDVLASGRIVASGADGGAGRGPGMNSNGGGGGGGGSGGTIAIDAPAAVTAGAMVVDGGRGAAGGPAISSSFGDAPLAPGAGGLGSIGGAEAIVGAPGAASGCSSGCSGAGGGGGGGGRGVVLVFR